jgi:hypothetical protein
LEVGAVRHDLDIEHDVVEAEMILEVGPHRAVGRKDEDPIVVRRDRQLARRAEHAVRHNAEDRPGADGPRQRWDRGARRCKGHEVARGHVPDAHDDLDRPRAGLDARDAQPVRAGVVAHVQNPRDHHA